MFENTMGIIVFSNGAEQLSYIAWSAEKMRKSEHTYRQTDMQTDRHTDLTYTKYTIYHAELYRQELKCCHIVWLGKCMFEDAGLSMSDRMRSTTMAKR